MNRHPRDEKQECYFQTNDLKPTTEEIEQQALHLGIDPVYEKELLWIAEKSWLSDIPPPWVPLENDKGQIYFYNTATEISMWDHPFDEHFRALTQQERGGRISRITSSSPEDSGIACITGNSVRSSPQSLKPIVKSSKSIIPPKLSADFLSPTLTVPNNSVPLNSNTKILSPMHDIPSKNLPSMNLPASFGKGKFLKSDQQKAKPFEEKVATRKESKKLVDQESLQQLKFSLDLDDDLCDVSHYSYEETDGLESEYIDPLDVANLLNASTKNQALINMAPPHSLFSSQDSSRRNSIQKNELDRPSIVPQNYRPVDEDNLSEHRSSENDSEYMSNLKTKPHPDSVLLNNRPTSAKVPEHLAKSAEVSDFSETSGPTGNKELMKVHEASIVEMERKYSEEKLILKNKHEMLLKREEEIFTELLSAKRKELEDSLKTQAVENEMRFKREEEAQLKQLTDEMKRLELTERSRLLQEFSKAMAYERELHDKEIKILKNKMASEIKEIEEEHARCLKDHREATAQLASAQEKNLQALKQEFSFQIEEEEYELEKEFEAMKSRAMKEHKIKLEGLKRDHESQLVQIQNDYNQKQKSEAIHQSSVKNESIKADLHAEADNLRLQVEAFRNELKTLKEAVNEEREAQKSQQFQHQLLQQISKQFESQTNCFGLLRSTSNNPDNNNVDFHFQRSNCNPNRSPNNRVAENCHMCRHHSNLAYRNENANEQSNPTPKKVHDESNNAGEAETTAEGQLDGFNEVDSRSDLKKLLEPLYKQLHNISTKVDTLQKQKNGRVDDSDSSSSNASESKKNLHAHAVNKVTHSKSPLDESVAHLSSNLLQVNAHLSSLIEDMNSRVPSYANIGLIGSYNPVDISSSKMPNISLSPSPFDHHSDLETAALDRWKKHNDSSNSSIIHEPGSYPSLIYPYAKTTPSSSARKTATYSSESITSTKERLDAQKKWLQEYHKKRQPPSYI